MHSPADEVAPATPRTQPLILIVEDERDLRQLYVLHLTMGGFDVIEAEDGAAAIAHTSAHSPDAVVMDLSLPILDGWEATRRIKGDATTAHIPILALTAHEGSGDLQRAMEAGCDWFVPKPCPPDALATELRRVLASR